MNSTRKQVAVEVLPAMRERGADSFLISNASQALQTRKGARVGPWPGRPFGHLGRGLT